MQSGDTVGQWVVDQRLSKGGQGVVYRVHSAWLDRPGALKVVNPNQVAASAGEFTRLKLEMRTLCDLHHPNIVGYLDSGLDPARKVAYLVMQFIDGRSLKAIVRDGPSPVDDVDRWFLGYAKALAFAHDNGVFHRDVKPDNLMVRNDGTPIVIDFGINYSASREAVTTGIVPMTLEYLPPEMFREWSAEPHMRDIYALGLCLFEALTGQLSHTPGPPSETLERALARIASQRRDGKPLDPGSAFPQHLRRAVREATQPEVAKRLQTMADFVAILEGERRSGIGWIAASAGAVAAAGITAAIALPVGGAIGWSLGSGGAAPVELGVEVERMPGGEIRCVGANGLDAVLLADDVPFGGRSAPVGALPEGTDAVRCIVVGDDVYGRSAWTSVINRAPSIEDVTLAPPTVGQDLRCQPGGAFDPDGDTVLVDVTWTVNESPTEAGEILPGDLVRPRARIECIATPRDWLSAGSPLSAQVSVPGIGGAPAPVPAPGPEPAPAPEPAPSTSLVTIQFTPEPRWDDQWPVELRPLGGGETIRLGAARQRRIPPGPYAVHVEWVSGSGVPNRAGVITVPNGEPLTIRCSERNKMCND